MGYLLSRTYFSGFTAVSCEGVEVCGGLKRKRAEGLVQQL